MAVGVKEGSCDCGVSCVGGRGDEDGGYVRRLGARECIYRWLVLLSIRMYSYAIQVY